MDSPAAAHGREVRGRLLAAAVELVPERGWTAVSTRVLADRAGVTPSVVHYHFPSLQALLTEAVLGAMHAATDDLARALGAAGSAEQAIDLLFTSGQGDTRNDPRLLLFVEAYLAATRDERLRDAMVEVLAGFRRKLGRWFAEHGVPAPERTAAIVLATLDGLALHRALMPKQSPSGARTVVRRLVEDR